MRADRALSGFIYQVDSLGPDSRAAGLLPGHQYQYHYSPATHIHVFAHLESPVKVGLANREARNVQLKLILRR